ncbi:MAG: extracellular solute-binding protein, partial [Patescibacteria group bacterium]
PLIAAYQQKNPNVKISYLKMNPQSYREKLVSRSKTGSTNQGTIEKPDIFRFHNTWLPEIKDIVAPLPPTVMSGDEFDKTFYPIHKKDLKVGNYYYGLPLEIDGLVLVYNESLFKKAGIATVPTTWDDIAKIVPKLTVKDQSGKLITSGIALGTTSNVDHFSDIFGLLLLQNGGQLNKLDQDEAAGALESYRKFSEPPQGYWTEEMANSTTAFIQEKVAIIIVPSWEILTIKSANPDIEMKVVPVPVVPGTSLISVASYWVEGVSRFSNNQLEAWKFLRFLTEKENMTKLYEIESKIKPFGEPYSRVDLAPLLIQDPYLGAVMKQANNFVSLPLISRTMDNGLNDEIIKYMENAINSTILGVSYKEALVGAKKGIDQVFTKYNISN